MTTKKPPILQWNYWSREGVDNYQFAISFCDLYSAFSLTVAIGNCMVKLIPPVNFCSDENIQTIFGSKLEDFLNYRIDYNSIS
jgi:hypothetical protein